MYTSVYIRRHIFSLNRDAIFATREFLRFGKRAAVDKCLSRLVKRGDIIRLARGIFKRLSSSELPSLFIIAYHKARAFERKIAISPMIAALRLDLSSENNEVAEYAISGHSSKFHIGKTTVCFKGINARKMLVGDGSVGLAIKGLSYLGQRRFDQETAMKARRIFNSSDRLQLKLSAYLMPGWLTNGLLHTS